MATRSGVGQAAPEPPAPRKRLVLVVHGIGHEPPGATVRGFAGALAATQPGRELAASHQVLYLTPEAAASAPVRARAQVFPCHTETLAGGPCETVLAEVYWEDVSRIQPTLLGALRGLFDLIFGLRHLAQLAADPRRDEKLLSASEPVRPSKSRLISSLRRRRAAAAAALRRRVWLKDDRTGEGRLISKPMHAVRSLSRLLSYLLRGPAAATAVLWHLGWLTGIAVLTFFVDLGAPDPDLAPRMPILTGLIGIAIGALGYSLVRRGSARLFFSWLALAGVLLAGIWTLASKTPLLPLASQWATDTLGVGDATRLSSTLVLGWVLSITPMILVGLCLSLMVVPWLLARLSEPQAYRPGLSLAFWVSGVATSLMILVMTFALVLGWSRYPEHELRHELKPWLVELVPRMGFLAVLWLLLAGALLIVWIKRRRWRDRNEDYSPGIPCPRLLLAPEIRWATLLHFGSFLILWPRRILPWSPRTEGLADVVIASVVLALTGAVSLAAGSFRSILDLGLDVITHFRPEEPPGDSRLWPFGSRPQPRRHRARFPYREKIQERFRAVWQTLVTRVDPSHVTVIAHSQGTMVALECLAEKDARRWMQSIGACDLVTMGSPFHHLYQYYFANEYPKLEDAERWGALAEHVSSWTNIFRTDDFVGTEIEPCKPFARRLRNRQVGQGGHRDYWTDREVLAELRQANVV